MESKKMKHWVGLDRSGSVISAHGTKATGNMQKARGFDSASKAVEYKTKLHKEQAERRKKP